jgi:hypothetical protein
VPGLPVAARLVLGAVADDSNSTVAGPGWPPTRVAVAVRKSRGHPKGCAHEMMGEIHRAFPPDVVERAGRRFTSATDTDVVRKAGELNGLADAVAGHTDSDAVERLIKVESVGPDFIPPQAIGGRT